MLESRQGVNGRKKFENPWFNQTMQTREAYGATILIGGLW